MKNVYKLAKIQKKQPENIDVDFSQLKNKILIEESYKQALIESSKVIVFAMNEFGVIQLFNSEALLKLEYSLFELSHMNKPFFIFDQFEIDLKRELYLKEHNVLLRENFELITYNALNGISKGEEYIFISKSGIRFPVSLKLTTIKDEDEHLVGFMAVAIDISEKKYIEKIVKESYLKEKQLNLMKSNFVSLASHQFKTPLCAITSSVFLLQEIIKGLNMQELDNYLLRINTSANMISNMLDDFLLLEKLELGEVKVKPYWLNIYELVTSTRIDVKNKVKQKIQYEHLGSPNIYIDGTLLKAVIVYLIINSSKFSSENSCIKINSVITNTEFYLVIKDTGIGISKDDQINLTNSFYKGSNASNLPGFGLGLNISSKYILLMGGILDYNSEIEIGTEIIIRFKNINSFYEKNLIN